MDMEVKAAAICGICKCSLDIHAPHAIVNHDYAHLDCADEYDSRDLGGLPDPGDLMGSEWPDIIDEEDHHGHA